MKKREVVKLEGRFAPDILRILRDVDGVTVEAPSRAGRGDGDAVLRFGPAAEPVAVEVKRRTNPATAWQLVQRSRAASDANVLLVAGGATGGARALPPRPRP